MNTWTPACLEQIFFKNKKCCQCGDDDALLLPNFQHTSWLRWAVNIMAEDFWLFPPIKGSLGNKAKCTGVEDLRNHSGQLSQEGLNIYKWQCTSLLKRLNLRLEDVVNIQRFFFAVSWWCWFSSGIIKFSLCGLSRLWLIWLVFSAGSHKMLMETSNTIDPEGDVLSCFQKKVCLSANNLSSQLKVKVVSFVLESPDFWWPNLPLFVGYKLFSLALRALSFHFAFFTVLHSGIFRSTCYIDVRWFPFDVQRCELKFGSWTYGGWSLDLQMIEADVTGYVANGEWDLVGKIRNWWLQMFLLVCYILNIFIKYMNLYASLISICQHMWFIIISFQCSW